MTGHGNGAEEPGDFSGDLHTSANAMPHVCHLYYSIRAAYGRTACPMP
jgi:hypothetical protein